MNNQQFSLNDVNLKMIQTLQTFVCKSFKLHVEFSKNKNNSLIKLFRRTCENYIPEYNFIFDERLWHPNTMVPYASIGVLESKYIEEFWRIDFLKTPFTGVTFNSQPINLFNIEFIKE